MASNPNNNPVMPKVAQPLPSLPGTAVRPGGGGEGNKDRLLADLRRQVFTFFSFGSFELIPTYTLMMGANGGTNGFI